MLDTVAITCYTLALQVLKQRDNVRALSTYMMSEVPPVLPSCRAYLPSRHTCLPTYYATKVSNSDTKSPGVCWLPAIIPLPPRCRRCTMRSSPSATPTWHARFSAPRGRGWWRWWGWRMSTASRRRYCARQGGATRGRGCAREVPEADCCGANDHNRPQLPSRRGATSQAAARAMRHALWLCSLRPSERKR